MKYEIQVHFENCGQLAWNEEIEDPYAWLEEKMHEGQIIAYDEDSARLFGFFTKTVTAYVISEKKNQPDLWERTYAAREGEIKKSSIQQHPGNDPKWPPTETGRGGCS